MASMPAVGMNVQVDLILVSAGTVANTAILAH
jgi:hypothetical protein